MPTSVAPTWEGLIKEIISVVLSVKQSIIFLRYGVVDVSHLPPNGDSLVLKTRKLSAQSLTDNFGGALNCFLAVAILSAINVNHFSCSCGVITLCKGFKTFSNCCVDNFTHPFAAIRILYVYSCPNIIRQT